MKWALALQDYNYQINYIKGKANAAADCLSRIPTINIVHPIPDIKPMQESIKNDTLFGTIIQIITNKPITHSINRSQKRFITNNIDKFILKGESLFFEASDGQVQLVIPHEYRQAIIESLHSSVLAGHLGIDKTIQRVKKFYYWPAMTKEIISRCE
jgi:hypothetical protein